MHAGAHARTHTHIHTNTLAHKYLCENYSNVHRRVSVAAAAAQTGRPDTLIRWRQRQCACMQRCDCTPTHKKHHIIINTSSLSGDRRGAGDTTHDRHTGRKEEVGNRNGQLLAAVAWFGAEWRMEFTICVCVVSPAHKWMCHPGAGTCESIFNPVFVSGNTWA